MQKFDSFLDKVDEVKPTMICITESHLHEKQMFEMEGYKVYRNDRDNKGGGVMICIKKELENICTVVEKSKDVGEMMWMVMDNSRIKIRVGVVYAPQESRTHKDKLKVMYEKIDEQILLAKEKGQKLLIVGDFNCKVGEIIAGNKPEVSTGGKLLLKRVERNKLSILNSDVKCNGLWTRVEGKSRSVIDYVMIDEENSFALEEMKIDEEREYSPIGYDKDGNPVLSDHNVILSTYNWLLTEQNPVRQKDRKIITHEGYQKIKEEMTKQQVSSIFCDGDVQNNYGQWKKTVMRIVESNMTSVKKRNPRKAIKVKIKERKRLKKIMKMKTTTTEDRKELIQQVKMLDQQIKEEHDTQYMTKINKVVEKLQGQNGIRGPNMWEVLKKVKRKPQKEPATAIKDKQGRVLEESSEIKERYIEHFKEILQPPKAVDDEEKAQEEVINIAFENILSTAKNSPTVHTTVEEVEVAIHELKLGKCKDESGWFNEIIVHGGPEMVKSLHMFINVIETERIVPSQWNEVLIKTVPKPGGSVLELDNKRGLFITEIISKVYEKILKKRNQEKINQHLSCYQTGGVEKRGPADNVFILSEIIRRNRKMGLKTYIVFGDAVKCFDKLWLKDCLVELFQAGCSPQDIQMIYEMNKDTVISIDTPSGKTDKLFIGEVVKQGTVLGPTLCSVETDQINHIGENQERNIGDQVVGILVFVDDIMSAGTADDVRKCIRNMRLMEIRKKFSYGLKKTKFMVVKTGREESDSIEEQVKEGHVTECSEYKYVGLWQDQEGNCMHHIKKKKEKIKGEIAAMKSITNYHNMGPAFMNVRLQLYQSCILKSLLFNLEGWNRLSKKEVDKLESIQGTSLCSLLGIPKSTPYIGLLNETGIWTIKNQLTYRKLMFYHNIINSDDDRLIKSMVIEQENMDDDDTFYMDVKLMASTIGLSFESIKNLTKDELKILIKENIDKEMVRITTGALKMTKLRFINEPTTFERKEYLLKMDGSSAIQVLKTRLNMLPVYGNFKGDLSIPRLCQWCDEEDDTTEHFLTCKVVGVCNLNPEHLRNADNVELWRQINLVVKSNMDKRVGKKRW